MRITIFFLALLLPNILLSQTTKPVKKERHETIIIKRKTILGDTLKTIIDTTINVDTIVLKPQKIVPKKYWKKGGNFGLNVTQTSFKNWVSGGEDAFSGLAILNLFANYDKQVKSWNNSLDIQYGLTHTSTQTTQKSIDVLKLFSKYNHFLEEKLFLSSYIGFNTQLAKGYNYPNRVNVISNFLAPGYLNLGVGLEHKPNKYLTFFLTPVSGKFTFVLDDSLSNAGAFGVEPGKSSFNELGTSFRAFFKKEILKNVRLQTTLNLFSSYNNNFGNVDVLWDLLLFFKINKYINATVTTGLIYDDDSEYVDQDGVNHGPKVQFKEIIGIGFSYNFGDK